jgi:hypothetical protein
MSQTSYSINQDAALEGQLADSGIKDVMSYTAEEDLKFGRAVLQGTADGQCLLPAGNITGLLGVAIHQHKEQGLVGSQDAKYLEGDSVNVLKKGRMWVKVEEAVVAQDPVYVRHTTGGGGTELGAFRKSADTSTAAVVSGMKYLTSADAAALALIEVDVI